MKDWDELSRCGEKVVKSFGPLPFREGFYVRIRPPNESECDDPRKDFRVLKFIRVGILVEVTNDGPEYVNVCCGGDTIVWERQEFAKTFVRLIDGNEFKAFDGNV
jgi:hypothetical protein